MKKNLIQAMAMKVICHLFLLMADLGAAKSTCLSQLMKKKNLINMIINGR